jgi:hypothetical protein
MACGADGSTADLVAGVANVKWFDLTTEEHCMHCKAAVTTLNKQRMWPSRMLDGKLAIIATWQL